MSEQPEKQDVQYLGVCFSKEGVAEFEGSQRTVFIPADKIQRLELVHGSPAERPVIQTVSGVVLFLIGCLSFQVIASWFREGGTISELHAALAVFLFIGGWMLWGVIRKRTYLLVSAGTDTRKLVFQGKVQAAELEKFGREASTEFGYTIQSRILGLTVS